MIVLRLIYAHLFGPSAWARAEAQRINAAIAKRQEGTRRLEELVTRDRRERA